jgi:hypothetical protein
MDHLIAAEQIIFPRQIVDTMLPPVDAVHQDGVDGGIAHDASRKV